MRVTETRTVPHPPPAAPAERWFTPANLMTLTRIPLAALPWIFLGDRTITVAAIVAAAISDGLDGFLARLREPDPLAEPPRRIGVWLDPLCDKIFAGSALGAAWTAFGVPLWVVGLLLTREILLGIFMVLRRFWPRPDEPMNVRASLIGKFATGAQFAALATLVWGHPVGLPLAVAACALGGMAALHYIQRAMPGEP